MAAPAKEVPANIQELINKLPLTDEDDNALKVSSVRYLEDERVAIYGALSEPVSTGDHVLAVECVSQDDADDLKEEDRTVFEKVIVVAKDEVDIVELEDKVTMEDLSPAQLIEYTFNENGPWFLAPMSLPSLEGYRKLKFANWRNMIENPTCEAAFKRLLNIGLITNMYDHIAFPSPESEKDDWMVKDDHGKDVVIPRPVQALRCWNVKQRAYEAATAHLDGAPSADEAGKFWEDMLNKFRGQRGKEYIDQLLASFKKDK